MGAMALRNYRGPFTFGSMGIASPRGVQKGLGMGGLPDNLPISLRGLVMEPEAAQTLLEQVKGL